MVIVICILACFIGGWFGAWGARVFLDWYRPIKMKRLAKKEFKKFCKAVGIKNWKKITPEEFAKILKGGQKDGREDRKVEEHL